MQSIGGALIVQALRRRGIELLFTLTGGHLFPVYDAWIKSGGRIIDTRHEATAAFAAEGLLDPEVAYPRKANLA